MEENVTSLSLKRRQSSATFNGYMYVTNSSMWVCIISVFAVLDIT